MIKTFLSGRRVLPWKFYDVSSETRFEWRTKYDNLILFLMVLGAVVFHITLNEQYDFYRDEPNFFVIARQLRWGYITYQPINSPIWDFTIGVADDLYKEMVGWQDFTKQVAEIYQSIPEKEKARTVIFAGNYGEPDTETVIVVGFEVNYARHFFKSCK